MIAFVNSLAAIRALNAGNLPQLPQCHNVGLTVEQGTTDTVVDDTVVEYGYVADSNTSASEAFMLP